MGTTDQVTATYFDVIEYIEADRSVAFVVQRTSYYVSDGAIFRRELLMPTFATRAEAEAHAGHLDATFPGA